MNTHLQLIEYQNQRILTTQQIAIAYETDTNNIYVNFHNNKDRYTEGKHYFSLEGETLKIFKGSLKFEGNLVDKYSPILYLWTEKGALMHAKSLNTDRAWMMYEELVDSYFRPANNPLAEIAEMRKELTRIRRAFISDKQYRIASPRERLSLSDNIIRLIQKFKEQNKPAPTLRNFSQYLKGIDITDLKTAIDEMVAQRILTEDRTYKRTRYELT